MPVPDTLFNGLAVDQISSHDRGLYYGDGLFETLAVIDGKIPLWQKHLARLAHGCRRLKLSCPDQKILFTEARLLAETQTRAILKIIITRGQGGRGYALPDTQQATRILQLHDWPDLPEAYWRQGVRVIYCRQQLAQQPVLAGIKHLNRLEQVLARSEWQDDTIQEGLLCDSHGDIIEAVSHNIFMLKDEHFITPDLQHCGVAGVMRDYVLNWLRKHDYSINMRRLDKTMLQDADAVFLCNSVHGIWPICDLDGKSYPQNRLVCELRDAVAQLIPYP